MFLLFFTKKMVRPSFTCFILIFHLLLLLLGEAESKPVRPDCPAFNCGNFGKVSFPLTMSDRPECGLCLVDGCNTTVPKIQLGKGGKWYLLKRIDKVNAVTLYDEELAKQLETRDCESLSNWSLPEFPFISFHLFPNQTLLKCNATLIASFPAQISRTNCSDYNLYYPTSYEPLWSSLPYCSISQLPANHSQQGKRNSLQNENNLFKLLTAEFSVELRVVKACGDCHYRGGQCLSKDDQEFYCTKDYNKHLGLKLGLGVGSMVVLISIIFVICFRRHSVKYNERFSHEKIHSSYFG